MMRTAKPGLRAWAAAWVCTLSFGCVSVAFAQMSGAGQTNGLAAAPAATHALRRVHVFVSGKVQGVGFRDFTNAKASGLGLSGWVMNLPDGRVELVAEGGEAALEKLIDAVARGPAAAKVDKIERKEEDYSGEFKQFEVRR